MSVVRDESKYYKIELDHYSHSQDMAARDCMLKWFRSAVMGWQSKKLAKPLHYGISVHSALESFHLLSPSDRSKDALMEFFVETYEQQRPIVQELAFDPDKELKEFDEWLESIGRVTIDNIWDMYGQDEQIPKLSQVEITFHVTLPMTGVPYETRLDALVLDVDEPFIFETKTMSRDNRAEFDAHDLQLPRNIYMSNMALKPVRPIVKGIYNFIVFPTKSRNGILERKEVVPTENEILFSIQDLDLRVKELTRDDLVISHNFSKNCQWKCDFYQLCYAQKTGNGDIEEMIESSYGLRKGHPGSIIEEKDLSTAAEIWREFDEGVKNE